MVVDTVISQASLDALRALVDNVHIINTLAEQRPADPDAAAEITLVGSCAKAMYHCAYDNHQLQRNSFLSKVNLKKIVVTMCIVGSIFILNKLRRSMH